MKDLYSEVGKGFHIDYAWDEDEYDNCNYGFGGTDFIITEEDIELLKQGKIINFTVNDEYGCTLAYEGNEKVKAKIERLKEESNRTIKRKFE